MKGALARTPDDEEEVRPLRHDAERAALLLPETPAAPKQMRRCRAPASTATLARPSRSRCCTRAPSRYPVSASTAYCAYTAG